MLGLGRLYALVPILLQRSADLVEIVVPVAAGGIRLEVGLILSPAHDFRVRAPGSGCVVLAASERVGDFLCAAGPLHNSLGSVSAGLLRREWNTGDQVPDLI